MQLYPKNRSAFIPSTVTFFLISEIMLPHQMMKLQKKKNKRS